MTDKNGICATCQYWRNGEQWGACTMTHSTKGQPRRPKTLAFARDSELWNAWLATRFDFSCCQHKARQETVK